MTLTRPYTPKLRNFWKNFRGLPAFGKAVARFLVEGIETAKSRLKLPGSAHSEGAAKPKCFIVGVISNLFKNKRFRKLIAFGAAIPLAPTQRREAARILN